MVFPFEVGQIYKRRDVFKIIGIPEDTKGGDWFTGYARHDNDWFIFCNIDVEGRTGHDYDNKFVGEDLLWRGKNESHIQQKSIISMVGPIGNVYIFVRFDNNAPFNFMGCGKPIAIFETKPVTILWRLLDPLEVSGKYDAVPINTHFYELGEVYTTQNPLLKVLRQTERKIDFVGGFNPDSIYDARERIVAAIVRRRGQPQFRQILLDAYEHKCAVTKINTKEVLEAAHIMAYKGPETNHPTNGLLLRSDIHTLFDLGHVAINPSDMRVLISDTLKDSHYEELLDKQILLPKDISLHPNMEALTAHCKWAGLGNFR